MGSSDKSQHLNHSHILAFYLVNTGQWATPVHAFEVEMVETMTISRGIKMMKRFGQDKTSHWDDFKHRAMHKSNEEVLAAFIFTNDMEFRPGKGDVQIAFMTCSPYSYKHFKRDLQNPNWQLSVMHMSTDCYEVRSTLSLVPRLVRS